MNDDIFINGPPLVAADFEAADLSHRLDRARSGDMKAKAALLESFRNYARTGRSVPPELAAFVVDVMDGNLPKYRPRPPLSESDQKLIIELMFRDPEESVDNAADRLDEDRDHLQKLWQRYKNRM